MQFEMEFLHSSRQIQSSPALYAVDESRQQAHCTVCVTESELPLMFESPW
jgi:hypothetical protein